MGLATLDSRTQWLGLALGMSKTVNDEMISREFLAKALFLKENL